MYSSKIKSIKKLGEIETFDLHTPIYHNFLLDNGILSHNSGKSWRDLRKAELWYQYHFKKPFPVENICFGVLQVMELISSGTLKKGDIIKFEEAGANLGNLDFQNKISKMFTYVLQSFRSMNIAIFFNLPYFSMLNKSARMLMHYKSESAGVDYKKKINRCKFFLHQVNQSSGKIYAKSPKIKYGGKIRKIKKFAYKIPSKYLIDAYEDKKAAYLKESTMDYTQQMRQIKEKEGYDPNKLGDHLQEVYDLNQQGFYEHEIAEKVGKNQSTVHRLLNTCAKKGFKVLKRPNKSEFPMKNAKNASNVTLNMPLI